MTDITSVAEDRAKATGVPVERLLLDALYVHFSPVPAELLAEFDAWELASDEDMALLCV